MACSRLFFHEESITRNSYICALHVPGESGPTDEFPDPLKANLTAEQARRAFEKRKAPERCVPIADPEQRKITEITGDRFLKEFSYT